MGKQAKSDRAGKCSAGRHDIKVGDLNYYEKVNEKWIRCTDAECFKEQGGSLPNPNDKPYVKAKTPEELFNYRKAFFEFCWAHAKNRAKEEIPDPKLHDMSQDIDGMKARANQILIDEVAKQRRILASSFLYALSGGK